MTVILTCFKSLQQWLHAILGNKYSVLETKQEEPICERKFKKRVCWKNIVFHHILLGTEWTNFIILKIYRMVKIETS